MPKELSGALISPAFTILRLKPELKGKIDPMYVWSTLRTPAIVAEWLSQTTGFGRHYVDWELIRKQRLPLPSYNKQKQIGDIYRKLFSYDKEIAEKQKAAADEITNLGLDDERAIAKLIVAKPPR